MPARLDGLTILRFFAALWVLLFHLQLRLPVEAAPGLTRLLDHGYLAMAFFFILSGAVLAYGYRDLRPAAGEVRRFYVARLARIYPAYAVLHLVAAAVTLPQVAAAPAAWSYGHLLSFLGLQAWFPHAFTLGVNSGSWSVSAEFFFYALFPALLPLLRHLEAGPGLGRTAAALAAVVAFIGLAGPSFDTVDTFPLYYTLPFFRLPEFVLGMVIGLALAKPAPAPARLRPIAAAGLGVIGAALLPSDGHWMRANFAAGPALAWLIFATGRAELAGRLPLRGRAARVAVYLGESSYCLFLAHLAVLLALDSTGGQEWQRALTAAGGKAAVWLSAITGSLLLAAALHEGVEKPARRALLR